MAWFIRKPAKTTYYCIGWTAGDPELGAFREVALPGTSVIRVMDKAVHQAALERAGDRLVELDWRADKDAI